MNGFGSTMSGLLAGGAFTLLLIGACVSDLRSRRIPNGVVAGLLLGGVVYALVTMPLIAALKYAIGGGAVGLAIWLPFWLAGVLGAGDVKLAAGAGAWLGAGGVVEASLVAAAVGGALAVWALARHAGVASVMTRVGAWLVASRSMGTLAPEWTPRDRRIPYGLAIAAGAAAAAWVPNLIW